jgi:hypothetical protein
VRTLYRKKETQYWLTGAQNWESFRQSLEEKINLRVPLRKEEQLDTEVEKFLVNIQQSAWGNNPEIKEENTRERLSLGNQRPDS